MKLSERWLREWVNPPVTTAGLVEQLTMAGLEIESVTPVAGDFSGVVIGKVLQVDPHPNADRLRVCKVDVGEGEPLTIVCGAANVRADLKVAVARVGAILTGGKAIQSASLRGVMSQGMICSAAELELQEESAGIMELPFEAPVGQDFRAWLQLDDQIIDVHLTPNRGDCLSVAGIAREIAVLNNLNATSPFFIKPSQQKQKSEFITVAASAACPRYLGRIINNINSNAKIPLEIAERLRRSGLRCVHPVVDITNYVMLELGQPLHAFDREKINGGIEVRFARDGEQITLLNEQTIKLDTKTLIIADKKQAQAIAGVMGGLTSAVSSTTQSIFLESAFFMPLALAGQARRYGLNTDSAYRFERGVDPNLPLLAIERATELLIEIMGGEADPIMEVVSKEHLPAVPNILLRKERIERVLGMRVDNEKVVTILQQLGMTINQGKVTPPSWRYDIAVEEDLIEEIARIQGYQHIPVRKPMVELAFVPQPETNIAPHRLRQLLIERGYHEAITYSFIAPKSHDLFAPTQAAIALANPISTELSVMRPTLWPGLLDAVRYNQNRQQSRLRLFEMGLRFMSMGKEIIQEPMLAGVVTGNVFPEQWGIPSAPADFFTIKNDVMALLDLTGEKDKFVFQKSEHPALHPSQASAIVYQDNIIGYVGALHPTLLKALELSGPVYLFELQANKLTTIHLPKFKEFSKFPSIRRDISFWVDASIPVQKIMTAVQNSAGEWLVDLCLFDVFQGKEAARSLALGLVLQHPTRTLIDNEVDEIIKRVVMMLEKTFTITLRE